MLGVTGRSFGKALRILDFCFSLRTQEAVYEIRVDDWSVGIQDACGNAHFQLVACLPLV